ncbi:DUF4396 domain-containing protein [Pantoea eucrina]|uniref:DUF4396 domain-containing protein n=1 Tax=Pantoea eucrina TaxID=472693 RepID=A0ABU5LFU6_9GAMM|nr:DUF4396 domain-containing protein [Pantoea eucrina]MDZ7278819.1 DUF4396 domain-containing protein [Pantoea eucrina]
MLYVQYRLNQRGENAMLNQWALPFLAVGACTALMISKDLFHHRQPIAIMNLIWPLTGLYLPFVGWLAWWYLGRVPSHQTKLTMFIAQKKYAKTRWHPLFISTSLSAAACIFGGMMTIPIITLLNLYVFNPAYWVQETIFVVTSLLVGLIFQYLALRQDEEISFWARLLLAFKTEAFPLLIYQSGIFIFMALALKFVLNHQLNPMQVTFWFMLQLALMIGFIFCWPANHFLIKRGLRVAI